MPKQADRLFLALKVFEISLVDEPANEKEIIVAKRKEQEEMTTAALQAAAAAAATPEPDAVAVAKAKAEADAAAAAAAEVVETDLDEGTPDEVVEAIKNLVENVAAIAKAKAKDGKDGKAGGGKLPAFLKGMEDKLKAEGVAKADIDKAVAAAKAAFGASGLSADEPGTKTQKVVEAASVAPPSEDELVMGVLEAISKAKSFTPGRIKKLVQLASNMDALLEELGIDKAQFGASGITVTPTAATPTAPLMDTAASGGAGKPANAIRKDAAGEQPTGLTAEGIATAVTKALEPVTQAQAELNGRLEAIEKARSPSTAPAADGTEVPTTKGKSFWGGIIAG